MRKVRFCENNFSQGIERVINLLEEKFEEVNVEVEPCLGYCNDCVLGLFAVVNEHFVQGETIEKLYDEIKSEFAH
ncbi:DUF1450 domain-containing protein [Halonatronum saccharophilum]|uniref:DUF1450 domain-containing protein n=1 Tax=Halonatronum saccharophilum TaxID=150060 RepID=UPI0004881451|nr:DUF1450 domain-containing protein [Halonatronum saccharophilum]